MNKYEKLEKAEKEAEALLGIEVVPETEETPPETETPPEAVAEETPPETPPELPPEEKPEEKPDKTDWKKKYKTLDGKYRAEVPRLRTELDQWKEHAVGLQTKINELEETIKAPKVEVEPEPDDSMYEDFAKDYPEVAKATIKDKRKSAEEIRSLREELAKLREKIEKGIPSEIESVRGELHVTKEDRFDTDMQRLVGENWRDIDSDPAFIEGLMETAPYTNKSKLQLLREAYQQFDADTVSQFFLDHLKSLPPVEEEPETPNLEQFVAPGKPGGGSPPRTGASQPSYTQKDYQKFMAESMKPGGFNPKKWGGKTETQVEAMFDQLIAKGKLLVIV